MAKSCSMLLLLSILCCCWHRIQAAAVAGVTGNQLVLEDAMDATKSPCDNFHEYACGNWHVRYQLRKLGAHDQRTLLSALKKELLVQHFESGGNIEGDHLLHTFYNSCLSGRQSLQVYVNAMMQQLPHNWPIVKNATTANGQYNWWRATAAVRRYGAQGLWRLTVQPNWQAGEQLIFYLLPPSFQLLGPEADEAGDFFYQRYFKYLLLELGQRVRYAAALAARLVEFERSLQALLPATAATRHVLHAPQTLQQLSQQLPQLQLKEYFQQLLGVRYTPELLLVADTGYLVAVERLLHVADPLVVSTWLLLQLPAHFELHLHEDTALAVQREHCLQQLNTLLPQKLTRLLLRLQHGSNAAANIYLKRQQHQLQQLFESIKLQFERRLNATPIFEQDAATQTLAIQKLHAMRLQMPTLNDDDDEEEESEEEAEGEDEELRHSYDAYLLRLSQAQAVAQFQLALDALPQNVAQQPATATLLWQTGPLDVNVYYRLKLNAIELPLGLLQPPPSTPTPSSSQAERQYEAAARLLGGMGYFIGHELIHGFDYDGINYDAMGHIAGTQWPARAIIRFGLRSGCYLGARYSNATFTINENIADSEGLRLAYDAFKNYQETNNNNNSNNLTTTATTAAMRTFFVAFAQNWCGTAATPPSDSKAQRHASHSERVNNALGNFPEFAEAFECKAGSLMHPPDKCRIW